MITSCPLMLERLAHVPKTAICPGPASVEGAVQPVGIVKVTSGPTVPLVAEKVHANE